MGTRMRCTGVIKATFIRKGDPQRERETATRTSL